MIDTLDAVRGHDFVARELSSHGLKAAARTKSTLKEADVDFSIGMAY